ncbi:MAG TPA: alanyl-tRNA editing protein [bacterium]|nr:alanyl-tRNA editing protein [bacterium]
MTQLLYLHDSYLREFDASLVAVDGTGVVLDHTAFYPGGGGQPSDVGSLHWAGGTARVIEMRRNMDQLWHVLEGPAPAVGTAVHGALDWDRRYVIMRYHSALHVLVGVIYKQFGALVTGGAIHPDRARMDFSLEDLNKDRVTHIEGEANRIIQERRRLLVRYVSREEFERSDLSRLAGALLPPQVREVRVIDIEGFDAQADGGTHVANTEEIGRLTIAKTENKGKFNRRLEIVLSS